MPHSPRALLAYFVLYFSLAFVWRSVALYRRTGVNPFVLPASDDAYGYVGRAFKAVTAGCAAVVVLLPSGAPAVRWLGLWPELQRPAIGWTGWVLLAASLLWLLVAQTQMGASWRIGIDTARSTELVRRGLFGLSRNPIFLGMRVNLLGFFLVVPAAVTLALLVAGEILIQIQVRLEEQHLQALHGETYAAYRAQVRRWL